MIKDDIYQPINYESNPPQQKLNDILGKIPTTTVAPTKKPKKISGQLVLYVSGSIYRLYIYDFLNNVWHYATLT